MCNKIDIDITNIICIVPVKMHFFTTTPSVAISKLIQSNTKLNCTYFYLLKIYCVEARQNQNNGFSLTISSRDYKILRSFYPLLQVVNQSKMFTFEKDMIFTIAQF